MAQLNERDGSPRGRRSKASANQQSQGRTENEVAEEWLRAELKKQTKRLTEGDNPVDDDDALITMAVIGSNKDFVRRSKIIRWLVSNTKSHALRARNAIAYSIEKPRHVRFTVESTMPSLEQGLLSYEMPMEDVDDSPAISWDPEKSRILRHRAAVFLLSVENRSSSEAQAKSTFRFLCLPPELRARIYELLFAFPTVVFDKRSIHRCPRWVFSECTETRLRVQGRPWSTNDLDGHEDKPLDKRRSLQTRPLTQIMSLLSVNKFINREATPVFYSINNFRMVEFKDFPLFTRVLAPSRLVHVRSISISYMPGRLIRFNENELQHAITSLHLHPGFQKLEVRIDSEKVWFKPRHPGVCRTYTSAEDLPGLKQMIKVFKKASELVFVGDCPEIEKYVRDTIRHDNEILSETGRNKTTCWKEKGK